MATNEAARPRRHRPVMLIMLLCVLASAGAGGWLLYSRSSSQGEEEAAAAPSEATSPQESPTLVSPEPFLVNLADPLGKRYLRVSFDIEVTSPVTAQEMQKRVSHVRDSILLVLSSKRFDDIRTTTGKGQLREEILGELNAILSTGKARKVYFKEFVAQ